MKKVVLILLICVYSVGMIGFSLKQFYCCGKLQSVTISFTENAKQNCGKANEKSGCCDNRYQFFKVKDNHTTADEYSSPVKHSVDLHFYTPDFHNINLVFKKITVANRSNAPPLYSGVPVYIYNSVFRI